MEHDNLILDDVIPSFSKSFYESSKKQLIANKCVSYVLDTGTSSDMQDNEEDSDDAPDVGSLKTSLRNVQTTVLAQVKQVQKAKQKEKKARKEMDSKRHSRNLQQKKEKMLALMLDPSVLSNAESLPKRVVGDSSADEDITDEINQNFQFTGKKTVFEQQDDQDVFEETFKIYPKEKGLHVVSLATPSNFQVEKALKFKNRLLFGRGVKRISNRDFMNRQAKRNVRVIHRQASSISK